MDAPGADLVSIHFEMWDSATCQTYDHLDSQLSISVASLYFFCNRPTVAALMAIGGDLVDPNDAAIAEVSCPQECCSAVGYRTLFKRSLASR